MIKVSIKLDVSLSKLVFGFIGLSAAAATVYYLSSKNEKSLKSSMKVKDDSSSKGNRKSSNANVDKQTHGEKQNTYGSNDVSEHKIGPIQFENENSEKQIFSDKDKSVSKDGQNLENILQGVDTNATFSNKITNSSDFIKFEKDNTNIKEVENNSSNVKIKKVTCLEVESSAVSLKDVEQVNDVEVTDEDSIYVGRDRDQTVNAKRNINDINTNGDPLKLTKDKKKLSFQKI